ncbi:(d)CMP kinase [Neoehrlichia mikurensis]|uniref:Cytidylate kinase n=1 Tax=Neoehrlichia mikurensis TaxID=89586 RepID=A0A9Q9BVD5_9RICK|nr:(d)CMP kinase [Neoehrlichia mikurensis]QXK91787.1 (d)CMP kinase [Neoehrlichia mikurensis]QXK93000.1 (d)CMP kinase [Neoehrlichia mikurensis]QXK93477.1 (d)CMP kinase [Neoehrlichia mikurensis]UTO55568.1 (d)CMP kinase [Neoehrlichia mikurensis]UTO56489.1 (d)CMP kinase [Neoehrlichia mikurensis]
MSINNNLIITIDGPSSAGKGSLARKIAKFFNLRYLDTGKLYRIIATEFIKNNLQITPNLLIDSLMKQKIFALLEDQNNASYYNNEYIGKIASILATNENIRSALLPIQHEFINSSSNGAVLDGRDTSSVIYPNANIKIFITAYVSIRAQRRFKELRSTTKEMYKSILSHLLQRDIRDTYRRIAPLKCVENSLYFNTSYMSKEFVFLEVIKKIKTFL